MAALAPIVGILTAVAQTGLSIASAVGAFDKKDKSGDAYAKMVAEEKKKEEALKAEEERKRKAAAWRVAGGKSGSILTGGQGVATGGVLKTQLGA